MVPDKIWAIRDRPNAMSLHDVEGEVGSALFLAVSRCEQKRQQRTNPMSLYGVEGEAVSRCEQKRQQRM